MFSVAIRTFPRMGCNPRVMYSPLDRRRLLSGTGTQQRRLVYEGPFGRMLGLLKKISIFSCGCTLIGLPLLSAFGNPEMSVVQRAAVGTTVCFFAIGTTATLHFVCKPYVLRIFIRDSIKSSPLTMEIETLTLLGMPRTTLVELNEVKSSADRIFSTFQSKAGIPYYIHEEKAMFGDLQFYNMLMEQVGISDGSEEKATDGSEDRN